MLGHHTVRHTLRPLVGLAAQLGHAGHNRREHVVAVEVVHVLHHGGNALQPHAGVDVLEGQVYKRGRAVELRFLAVILRKDVVPDFQKAGALAGVGVLGPGVAAIRRATVIENLAARPTRPVRTFLGRVGGPEVLVGPEAQDVVLGQPDFLRPDFKRLLVVLIDGGVQLAGVQGQPLRRGQQFPGPGDRLALEIIAKTEVAQHFQQRAVTQGAAHVLDVAHPQALLGGGHAPVDAAHTLEAGGRAHELRLERLHAGHGKQRGRVGGDGGMRRQAQVAFTLEKMQVLFADLRRTQGGLGGRRSHNGQYSGSTGAGRRPVCPPKQARIPPLRGCRPPAG